MASQTEDAEVIELQDRGANDQLLLKRKADAQTFRREKSTRCIVDALHVSVMVSAYNHHIAVYSKGRKQVTQLIPSAVWKPVYSHYKKTYPDSAFQEETLKDRLREALKELKSGTAYEGGPEKDVLQNEEFLIRMRSTPGHASGNILKRRQSLVDGAPLPLGSTASTGSIGSDAVTPILPPSPMPAPSEKPMTKAQMLQQQASIIASMASQFHVSSEKQDALLKSKLDRCQAKCKKYKIANLKSARECGVITEEELKEKVKEVLNL